MKRRRFKEGVLILSTVVAVLAAGQPAGAEYPPAAGTWTWGAGGAVHFEIDSFGIQGQGIYGFNDQIRFAPSATFFFDDAWFAFDGDVQYVFPLESASPLLFGFGGLDITTDFDHTEVGLNLGAGLETRLSENLGGELKLKYVISDLDGFVLSFGVLF